jgi:molybdopterin molybdotransferase
MLTPTQALEAILAHTAALPARSCPLDECPGEILRETLFADRPFPPFDRVTMDGFAVCAEAFTGSAVVEGICPAGTPRKVLTVAASALEVMTGAILPEGCDTVIPVEWTRQEGDRVILRDGRPWQPGQFVHRAGSDLAVGAAVLLPGVRLLAPQIAVAATLGKTRIDVSTRPRIRIVTTGDEIVPVSAQPLPHQIRASNPHALAASLALAGFDRSEFLHLADESTVLAAGLSTALAGADVLLITGGVSAGAFDFVPDVLARVGAGIIFHKVAQRPGKPLLFARGPNEQLVFGLPGNPLSCLICLHRYVLPALFQLMQATPRSVPVSVPLAPGFSSDPELTLFKLVRIENGIAIPLSASGSGDLTAPAASNGFVEMSPVSTATNASFYPWSNP